MNDKHNVVYTITASNGAPHRIPEPQTGQRHFLVKDFRYVERRENGLYILLADLPAHCLGVELLDDTMADRTAEPSNGDGAVFNMLAYHTVAELLYDLYAHYLVQHFPPDSYGCTWVLSAQQMWLERLIIPWYWLRFSDKSQFRIDQEWIGSALCKDYGLLAQTYCSIRIPTTITAFGLTVTDPRIVPAVESYPRIVRLFEKYAIVKSVQPDAIIPTEYNTFAVYQCDHKWMLPEDEGRIYIQIRNETQDYERILRALTEPPPSDDRAT